jgi:hypothetical protein
MQKPTFLYDNNYTFHLNSKNRIKNFELIDTTGDGGGDTLVDVSIPSNFDILIDFPNNTIKEYDSVCLIDVTIPKSYYAIQEGLNSFILKEEISRDGSFPPNITYIDTSVRIEPGNYSATSFATILETRLNEEKINPKNYTNYLFSVSFDVRVGKFSISLNFAEPLQSYVWGLSFSNYMFNRLGFDPNRDYLYNTGIYLTKPYTLISPNVIDMSPETDILIKSTLISGAIDGNDNILYDVSTAGVPPFGITNISNINITDHTRELNTTTNIFNFQLVDEFNNPINMNKVDWSCTLFFYKKSTIPELIKNFISYIVNLF